LSIVESKSFPPKLASHPLLRIVSVACSFAAVYIASLMCLRGRMHKLRRMCNLRPTSVHYAQPQFTSISIADLISCAAINSAMYKYIRRLDISLDHPSLPYSFTHFLTSLLISRLLYKYGMQMYYRMFQTYEGRQPIPSRWHSTSWSTKKCRKLSGKRSEKKRARPPRSRLKSRRGFLM